jgi:copper homeostasis protein
LATILVEACVETLDEALAAEQAGAGRVELCANLAEDGLTPASALAATVVRRLRIPVVAIARPRPGGFVYDASALAVMLGDIGRLADAGVAGVVAGALAADGSVDAAQLGEMVGAARGLPVTFHRAFDRVSDMPRALEALIDAGVGRVLTSGGAPTALEGAETIAALVRQARDRIVILAGGSVRAHNVRDLVARTGVGEVHSRFAGVAAMRALAAAVHVGLL